jgi:asparagine synthase (glutamine-hydrolysing)
MCGIAGILSKRPVEATLLERMETALVHRGPDDRGHWSDDDAGIGLAHRRLSIVDLSPLGHQPMASQSGRFMLCYNGEIYNHAALRAELDQCGGGIDWRGHSDTETLVEGIAAWGLEATLSKCVGMFALALWDRRDRSLSLARDRFGEKPLYYGWVAGDLMFASELKAMRVHPRFDNAVDRRSLGLFAGRTHVPAPRSIYEHIFKLEPGCILVATSAALDARPSEPPRAGHRSSGLSIERYWSYQSVVAAGQRDPIGDEQDALDALEATLAEAIRGQSLADVPVGAFLSGGIDSSTIVALYQKYSATPVRTFSMGFEQAGYDEAHHAKVVAAHLGTIHRERYVSVADARDVIPLLPAMYDEPFADSSQIPTHLVSRFAREHVTVALSGDGGDELFAGYNRHFAAPRLWRQLQRVPRPLRRIAGATLGRVPGSAWGRAAQMLGRDVQPHFGTKLRKALAVGGTARSFDEVYDGFIDEWAPGRTPVCGASVAAGADTAVAPLADAPDTVRTMYRDAMTYLPDDILCKVDRAAMAVSLETRVPFLDHRVAELAARIPLAMKVGPQGGKQILRKLLYREAPAALFERPKTGFAVPVGEWIKGPLRPWAEELLDERRLSSEGWFDAPTVRRRWRDHLSGRADSTPALWAVLMYQAWQDEQVK